MRKLFILTLILFVAIPFALNAQERTLFKGEGEVESGFYCRPVLLKVTAIDGEAAAFGGIGGTWIIGHRVCGGVSYRFVEGVRGVTGISDMDLSGLSGTIFLKFGWF